MKRGVVKAAPPYSIMDKNKKIRFWIPISELRLYYLLECECSSEWKWLTGRCDPIEPTLTGWIKYWRKTIKEHPDWAIIYKQRK